MDALRACVVRDPSPSLSAHSFPLTLPPPEDPPPKPYAGAWPLSSTAARNKGAPAVFLLSATWGSARRFDAAELLRRGLPTAGPAPTEPSETTVGGDFDENLRLPDDCDVTLGGGLVDVLLPAVACGWKTGTLAREAMSSQPICQCMASTARQGKPISFAIMSHISFLNL
jgi:hypothetical protein